LAYSATGSLHDKIHKDNRARAERKGKKKRLRERPKAKEEDPFRKAST
jgi:hypothetical protein